MQTTSTHRRLPSTSVSDKPQAGRCPQRVRRLWWALTVALLGACSSGTGWEGVYTYESSYGSTAGGTPIGLQYMLQVGPADQCAVEVDGFQTSEALVCQAAAQEDALRVMFARWPEGSAQASASQSIYQAGEVLFILRRKDGQLLTEWGAMRTLDMDRPADGVLFVARKP